jgi:hypothetical protein
MTNRLLGIALLAAAACGSSPNPTASSLELSTPLPASFLAGSLVSFSVLAESKGVPVAGVHVGFVVTAGGGTMLDANASTGADGVATARWTLGKLAGAQTVIATADGAPGLSIDTTAVAGQLTAVAVTAPSTSLQIGAKLQLSAVGVDANGNPVAGNASWSSTTPATASVSADGIVTGLAEGSATVQAEIGGVSGSARLIVRGLLTGTGTATIDGTLSPGEWDGATEAAFDINVNGSTRPGRLLVMNNGTDLFFAVSFASAADDGSSVALEFDTDGNQQASSGDDFIVLNSDAANAFLDGARTTAAPCPPNSLCGLADTDLGGTSDGAGAFHYDGTSTVYEARHPLNSGDPDDFALHSGSVIGTNLSIRIIPSNGAIFDNDFPGLLGTSGSYLQITIH